MGCHGRNGLWKRRSSGQYEDILDHHHFRAAGRQACLLSQPHLFPAKWGGKGGCCCCCIAAWGGNIKEYDISGAERGEEEKGKKRSQNDYCQDVINLTRPGSFSKSICLNLGSKPGRGLKVSTRLKPVPINAWGEEKTVSTCNLFSFYLRRKNSD